LEQLRQLPAYLEVVDAAREDGADLMVTLLTHVGWNKRDSVLSIYERTSAVGRAAFAEIGFSEPGPTGASIREVLTRAASWSTNQGFLRLSRQLTDFIAVTWPAVRNAAPVSDDVLAESSAVDDEEVDALAAQVLAGDFAVADQRVTAKTRGSAQRVFAGRVKKNYGWSCALTGISTQDFLVASHIVPWSEDESIRLDPANGICLSIFVDRAFDAGYLLIHDDCTVHVDWDRVGSDGSLRDALGPFDSQSLTVPATSPPNPEFLRRRLGRP
jgi:hypothetical protein